MVETCDCLGVRRRPGTAWSGQGATEWLPELVGRLRAVGVKQFTAWLDKGFFPEDVVRCLQNREVSYLLKVLNHPVVRGQLRPWRRSSRAEGIFEDAESVWTSSGRFWGGRLLSLEGRRSLAEAEDSPLKLKIHEVTHTAHVLTDWKDARAPSPTRCCRGSGRWPSRACGVLPLGIGLGPGCFGSPVAAPTATAKSTSSSATACFAPNCASPGVVSTFVCNSAPGGLLGRRG